MNNYSNIPEEYLVKHGYNNGPKSNSTTNNRNINNKQYNRLLKKVKDKGQVDIKKEMETRYRTEIEKIRKAAKDNDYNKEQTSALFEKLIHTFREKVRKCGAAVKSIESSLKSVDFEGLELVDALKLGTSYDFENPDPELLISLTKRNDFEKVIERVIYIVFRKSKKELDNVINEWMRESKDDLKSWADEWPDEIKYWQYWVKLSQQMLSRRVDLEKYKVYENIHKLKMEKYDFTHFNKPYQVKDEPFSSSSRSNSSRESREERKSDEGEKRGKRRDKKRGKGQRGGNKNECKNYEKKIKQLQARYNTTSDSREKQKIQKQINTLQNKCGKGKNGKGKSGKGKNGKGKSGKGSTKSMDKDEIQLFRILAGGVEDKSGYVDRDGTSVEAKSIWNKICGKMRREIYKKLEHDLRSVDNIKNPTIIDLKINSIQVWPIIFYKDSLTQILTKDLKNNNDLLVPLGVEIPSPKATAITNITNNLEVKTNFKNFDIFNDNTIKTNIATYLVEKYGHKTKSEIKTDTSKAEVYTLTNPFTCEVYSNDKLKDFGGNIAEKYISFFNLFSINFIEKDSTKLKEMYKKTKNKIFVGLLEYYHNAAIVLNNIIKQLCYEYSISEKRICNNKGDDESKKENNNKNKEDKKGKNKRDHKKMSNNNGKRTVKRVKSLLNDNKENGDGNENENENGNVTKEQVNNAKIIVSINDQIKEMVTKAQNAENYNHLNRITDFLEEHQDKLKEMDYTNAVNLLNDIRK